MTALIETVVGALLFLPAIAIMMALVHLLRALVPGASSDWP